MLAKIVMNIIKGKNHLIEQLFKTKTEIIKKIIKNIIFLWYSYLIVKTNSILTPKTLKISENCNGKISFNGNKTSL